MVGQPLGHFVAPEHRDLEYLGRNRLLAAGVPEDLELLMVRPNQSPFWGRVIGNLVDQGGAVLCQVALADISDRKKAEAALVQEKELLALTLDGIADGVITLDETGKVRTLNPAAEVLTGWPLVEAVGHALSTVFPVMGADTPMFLRTPTAFITRTGELRRVTGSVSPIRSPSGEPLGTVLVFRDVSEKQKLAEALQRTDKLDSLGVLAGGIAHDFNNLLGGIFGYLSLARDVGHPEVSLKYLDKAIAVFQRAKGLTMQLLTFSSGGAPQRTQGRLGDLILKTSEFALAGSNVTLETSLPQDLWSSEFDEHQIEQVMDNLVINARQAMPHGGTVTITARNLMLGADDHPQLAPGPYLEVTVADEGEGVPSSHRGKIFDPFFTTKPEGHGLGLATCHSIVMKHGGTLELVSHGSPGAIFRFLLPASTSEACDSCSDPEVEHRGLGTVVILDDEVSLREVLGAQLGAMGYKVLAAADGSVALDLARECSDLQAGILDLTVKGGLGGRETLTGLRIDRPGLPVVATSGYSEDPVMADPEGYGFTASLPKPYQLADLARVLSRILPTVSGRP